MINKLAVKVHQRFLALARRGDAGDVTVQHVIWAAIGAAMAIAVALAIKELVIDKAQSIDLG